MSHVPSTQRWVVTVTSDAIHCNFAFRLSVCLHVSPYQINHKTRRDQNRIEHVNSRKRKLHLKKENKENNTIVSGQESVKLDVNNQQLILVWKAKRQKEVAVITPLQPVVSDLQGRPVATTLTSKQEISESVRLVFTAQVSFRWTEFIKELSRCI